MTFKTFKTGCKRTSNPSYLHGISWISWGYWNPLLSNLESYRVSISCPSEKRLSVAVTQVGFDGKAPMADITGRGARLVADRWLD
jgi:hypothetical protein